MRKLVISFICILLLAGCGKKAPAPVTVKFTCDFSAEYNGMTFAGSLRRDMAGTLALSLTSPESLAGMELTWDGNGATVSLGALQYTVEAELPQTAVPRLVLAALDDLFYAASAGTLTAQNGNLYGRVGDYAYTVQTDPDSGTLLSMEFPDAGLTARFTNVQNIT